MRRPSHRLRRRAIGALAAALAVLGFAAGPASASHGQVLLFDGGSALTGSDREQTFDQLAGLGVKAVRVMVNWKTAAPERDALVRPSGDLTDPGRYTWGGAGAAIDEAHARGWKVVVTLNTPAPRWATEGAVDNITRPRPSDLQHFFTAAGRRFGASATWWAVLNEPNLYQFLLPQYVKGKPAAGGIYRSLFLAARTGLNAAGLPKAKMLFGETAPRGNNLNVAPLALLRGALCLNKQYKRVGHCKKLPIDGYAHHPYTTAQGPYFVPPRNKPDDVTLGSLSRLEQALDKAAKAKVVKKHLPIFFTEFGVQSYPDKSLGVSLSKQSDYRSIAEYMAWKDPRVAGFSQYLLYDDAPREGVPSYLRYGGFESGLIAYAGEKRKPAYNSFRTPLVVLPGSKGKATLWGLVRPAAGATKVRVETSDKGRAWKKLLIAKTKADGSWTAKTSNRTGRTWRVRWSAPDGTAFVGPATRAYKDTRH